MSRCFIIFSVVCFIAVAGEECFNRKKHEDAWTKVADACVPKVQKGRKCTDDFIKCLYQTAGYTGPDTYIAFISAFANDNINSTLKNDVQPCSDKFSTKDNGKKFGDCVVDKLQPKCSDVLVFLLPDFSSALTGSDKACKQR